MRGGVVISQVQGSHQGHACWCAFCGVGHTYGNWPYSNIQHRLSAPLLSPPSPQLLAIADLSAGSRVLLFPECQSTEIIDVLVFLFLWGK